MVEDYGWVGVFLGNGWGCFDMVVVVMVLVVWIMWFELFVVVCFGYW